MSQLAFFDYVLSITIGSIATTLTTDLSSSAWPHWVGLFCWALLGYLMEYITMKWRYAAKYIEGEATIFIMNGKIMEDALRKFLVRAIPIVTVILFIIVMNSDNFLKRSLGKNDDIPKIIQLVIDDINEGRWDDAAKKNDELFVAWKKIVRRVQFSAEKDEINSFDVSIARLRGAIFTKNKSEAIMELNEAYEHWDNIGK